MSTKVLTDAYVEFDTFDMSSFVRQVTVNYGVNTVDETAMGDDTEIFKGGLKQWSVELELNQDWASSQLDDTLFAKVGTTGTVKVRPDSAAVGAGNPELSGTGLLEDYPPLGNSVGELATTTVTISSAGTLSRATS